MHQVCTVEYSRKEPQRIVTDLERTSQMTLRRRNAAEMERTFRPALSIHCDQAFAVQSAADALSALGYQQSPNAAFKMILDTHAPYALRMLESTGASHASSMVVSWNATPEYLQDLWDMGIGALIAGRYYDRDPASELSDAIEQLSKDKRHRHIASEPSALTASERPVLRLMACGLQDSEIAQRTYTTVQTVSNRATSVRRKLGLRNRLDAMLYYFGIQYGCEPKAE